jgi:hypothetical protein
MAIGAPSAACCTVPSFDRSCEMMGRGDPLSLRMFSMNSRSFVLMNA